INMKKGSNAPFLEVNLSDNKLESFNPDEIGFSTHIKWISKTPNSNDVYWKIDRCREKPDCGDMSMTCAADDAGYKVCNCKKGFTVNDTNPSCTDIDECQSNSGRGDCDHKCQNSLGSYKCSCNSGYKINLDEKTC
ncbi:unnamed protein product, partial [Meganyctiphanes norvegica]